MLLTCVWLGACDARPAPKAAAAGASASVSGEIPPAPPLVAKRLWDCEYAELEQVLRQAFDAAQPTADGFESAKLGRDGRLDLASVTAAGFQLRQIADRNADWLWADTDGFRIIIRVEPDRPSANPLGTLVDEREFKTGKIQTARRRAVRKMKGDVEFEETRVLPLRGSSDRAYALTLLIFDSPAGTKTVGQFLAAGSTI